MVSKMMLALGSSWLAGVASFVGGCAASLLGRAYTPARRELIHGVVAFGGGILVAAVAFALAPVGMTFLSPVKLAFVFSLGGVCFCVLDARISRHGGSRAQFMAMMMDFLPEAISLGAVFGHDHSLGMLLALFIGAQNLPEGFNAYRELMSAGANKRETLISLFVISFLGPVAAWLGYAFLQNNHALTAAIMCFAAGGILYLIFQDIAPQSTMRRRWAPPLGAVLGFLVGMLGKMIIG